jgi:UDPglucose 6-dehydrogenase
LRIGIIGFGTVGKAIHSGFDGSHEVFVHDPKLGTDISEVTGASEVAYIAVPTPTIEPSATCDTGIIEGVLEQLPNGFRVIIKSTVIPGTTQRLHDSFPKLRIACSPEFLRSKSSMEDFRNQSILVVGTHHEELAKEVFEHHREAGVIGGGRCFHVTPTQAELVKYAKNAFYAMKVIFGNQFQDYAKNHGEDWSVIKEIMTASQEQPIGPSHLDYLADGQKGFGGDCLPKDTLALVTELERLGLDYELLRAVLNDNSRIREQP